MAQAQLDQKFLQSPTKYQRGDQASTWTETFPTPNRAD